MAKICLRDPLAFSKATYVVFSGRCTNWWCWSGTFGGRRCIWWCPRVFFRSCHFVPSLYAAGFCSQWSQHEASRKYKWNLKSKFMPSHWFINHWFPLTRPSFLNPSFWRGIVGGEGWLAMTNEIWMKSLLSAWLLLDFRLNFETRSSLFIGSLPFETSATGWSWYYTIGNDSNPNLFWIYHLLPFTVSRWKDLTTTQHCKHYQALQILCLLAAVNSWHMSRLHTNRHSFTSTLPPRRLWLPWIFHSDAKPREILHHWIAAPAQVVEKLLYLEWSPPWDFKAARIDFMSA